MKFYWNFIFEIFLYSFSVQSFSVPFVVPAHKAIPKGHERAQFSIVALWEPAVAVLK